MWGSRLILTVVVVVVARYKLPDFLNSSAAARPVLRARHMPMFELPTC